jgi:site-specific DNA-adenine methylase
MCKYAGGKKRIAKELHDVMIQVESELVGRKMPYLEPFCGMLSVCKEFDDGRRRTASDINKDVIMMWDADIIRQWSRNPHRLTLCVYGRKTFREMPIDT